MTDLEVREKIQRTLRFAVIFCSSKYSRLSSFSPNTVLGEYKSSASSSFQVPEQTNILYPLWTFCDLTPYFEYRDSMLEIPTDHKIRRATKYDLPFPSSTESNVQLEEVTRSGKWSRIVESIDLVVFGRDSLRRLLNERGQKFV